MTFPRRSLVLLLATLVPIGLLTAGCGSSSSDSTSSKSTKSTETTTPKAATEDDDADSDSESEAASSKLTADSTINVEAGEMYFKPTSYTTKAGNVKFVLKNVGKVEHELIVLKTDAAVDSLKVNAKGRVSEAGSVGEVSETEAGESKSEVIKLTPGKYLLVCNIPGHYAGGMRATMVVT